MGKRSATAAVENQTAENQAASTQAAEGTAPPSPRPGDFRMLPCDEVEASLTNPRRLFDEKKMAELVESVRVHGVVEPILTRPREGGGFECVAGERRRRAARGAGLREIPAIVRHLTNLEVLEIQLIENGQRVDVHPLEEAEAIARLHAEPYKMPLTEIAAKLGKSLPYVYRRLKLCELARPVQDDLLAGVVTLGAAEQLARIAPDRQVHALAQLKEQLGIGSWAAADVTVSAAAATSFLRDRVLLKLAQASFDLARVDLVGSAGACLSCSNRTGAQRDFFDDVGGDDRCLDPDCFKAKTDAAWAEQVAQAEARGRRVLSDAETKRAFSRWGNDATDPEGPFVALSDRCAADPKSRTFKQLLGKEAPIAIARAPQSGKPIELVARTDVQKVLVAKGIVTERATPGRSAAAHVQRDAAKLKREVNRRALARVLDKVHTIEEVTLEVWRLLVTAFVENAWYEVVGAAAIRRGLVDGKNRSRAEAALRKAAAGMNERELLGLMLELLVMRNADSNWGDGAKYLRQACTTFGFDYRTIETEVKAEAKAKKADKGVQSKATAKDGRTKAASPKERRRKGARKGAAA